MNTENINKEKQTKALSQDAVSGSICFEKNSFALVEHTNNDTDIKEYGDVVGETQDYFLVKPHLRKEQNRWLKVDCKVVEYYR
jgi:hypothetical protein